MRDKIKVLIIDDEVAICEVLSASLEDEGHIVKTANDGLKGLQIASEWKPHVVLLDIWMPGSMDGLDVLQKAQAERLSSQFIIMSGHGTIETAVRATKLGAWDFIEKPLSMDKVCILIENILNYTSEKEEKMALIHRLRKNFAIVGESDPMVHLKKRISMVAPTLSQALIKGKKGTGKALLAQNIHYLSSRAGRPFVEVNCSSIPEELMECELFGYEKGALVGADRPKKGKFDYADGGTLFLSEIGDVSLHIQQKILKALESHMFQRVGGEKSIQVDLRLLASTHKDLNQEISKKTFSEELYGYLNTTDFDVPDLKDRKSDVHILVAHFGEQFAYQSKYKKKIFSDKSLEMLKKYHWPGNVRELRNFVERVYILTLGERVDIHDLYFAGFPDDGFKLHTEKNISVSSSISSPMDSSMNSPMDSELTFREARIVFEKDFLKRKIADCNGNISKTAEHIGLERSYLYRKIKGYGIEV